jgi:hypothetical protein
MKGLKDYINEAVATGKSSPDRYKYLFKIGRDTSVDEIVNKVIEYGFYQGRRRSNGNGWLVIREDIIHQIYKRNIVELGKEKCVCRYSLNGRQELAVLMGAKSKYIYCALYDSGWGKITMVAKLEINGKDISFSKGFEKNRLSDQLEELNLWLAGL